MLKLDSSLQTNNSRIFDNAKIPAKQTQAKGSTLANPSNLNSETLVGDVGKLFDSNNLKLDDPDWKPKSGESEMQETGNKPKKKSYSECLKEWQDSQSADLQARYEGNEGLACIDMLVGLYKYLRQK